MANPDISNAPDPSTDQFAQTSANLQHRPERPAYPADEQSRPVGAPLPPELIPKVVTGPQAVKIPEGHISLRPPEAP
jgi:hypothetical protein